MTNFTGISRTEPGRRRTVARVFGATVAAVAFAAQTAVLSQTPVPSEELRTLLLNAADFVRSQQKEDGSFAGPQPRLQAALATLALLSASTDPTAGDAAIVEKAAGYLVRSSPKGNLADEIYPVESHAIATLALLCSHPRLRSVPLREKALKTIAAALKRTQRMQDRSSATPSRGGWRMQGHRGRENDRRASAWCLLCYDTARAYGIEIPRTSSDRGARFLLASLKKTADFPDQIGGLSVDTHGLAVPLMSSIGGWALARLQQAPEDVKKNLGWLDRHPAAWSGPNYFYTNFFRVRALKLNDRPGDIYARSLSRLYLQMRDAQAGDGRIGFPPRNAQNTVTMGPVFSTSLAILILNIEDSSLVFDEDHRPAPLF